MSDDLVEPRWRIGDLVQKKANSKWRGVVVGHYSTETTPAGYSVKSLFEPGSVQVWPEAALTDWDGQGTPEHLTARITALEAEVARLREVVETMDAFPFGMAVEKVSGPEWQGKVCGYYSATFTPSGLVIECTAPGAIGQVHVEPAKRVRAALAQGEG